MMGYYMAGDYYAGGDYYAAGGLFGTLGSIVGTVAKVAGSIIPGPIGSVATAAGKALTKSTAPKNGQLVVESPVPGIGGALQRLIPGGASGYEYKLEGKKRRRMNVANPRALRKAIRRQAGFVKLARRALKGTGYTIASRGRSRRPVSIREAGPGSVVVR